MSAFSKFNPSVLAFLPIQTKTTSASTFSFFPSFSNSTEALFPLFLTPLTLEERLNLIPCFFNIL